MVKKGTTVAISEDTFSWITAGLALAAVIVLNHYGLPQKWHAAVMWTLVASGPTHRCPPEELDIVAVLG
jgi:hypothetical protein